MPKYSALGTAAIKKTYTAGYKRKDLPVSTSESKI